MKQRMKRNRKPLTLAAILPALGALLLCSGCGEALMPQDVDTSTPIVESYLEEGANSLEVKVYSMEVYLGDDYIFSKPITGLSMKVNEQELTETGRGVYTLELGDNPIRQGEVYALSFNYGGKSVKASTIVPQPVGSLRIEPAYIERSASYGYWYAGSDTADITLSWENPDKGYYQVYVDASNVASTSFGGNSFRRRMMQPVQADSYVLSQREFMSPGSYSIYVYRVNKEYVELFERISSSDLSNPVSFIDNALGVFTAVSVAGINFQVIEVE
jgi:hypothetical protein